MAANLGYILEYRCSYGSIVVRIKRRVRRCQPPARARGDGHPTVRRGALYIYTNWVGVVFVCYPDVLDVRRDEFSLADGGAKLKESPNVRSVYSYYTLTNLVYRSYS